MFFSIATVYFEFAYAKTHDSSNFGTLLVLMTYTVTNEVAVIIVHIFIKMSLRVFWKKSKKTTTITSMT